MTNTDPIDDVEASWVAREPVLATYLGAAAGGAAAAWAHTHYGTDQNTVTQFVVPAVTGLILTGLGIITRELVVPLATYSKKMEAEVLARVNQVLKLQTAQQKPAVQAGVKPVATAPQG